ncbi:c-type cytochrome [Trinickia caryophylli]|uniref:Cytochrome c n=1 Tax=Trinickia caryophylli TaxID=28094 RepID=A0A1X7FI32_TRICW|nr:cytochrome c551 [Trinickia caryophylli]SMF52558.1 cytochrome c [Trinickia caryophylli]
MGVLSLVVRAVVVGFGVTAVSVGASSVALAGETPDGFVIARNNACLGCHAVDRKLVGPSFLQVAAKYKGDPQGEAKLVKKVKEGGAGVWGVIPMPAHPRMNDNDVKSVVDWVLAGAPQK